MKYPINNLERVDIAPGVFSHYMKDGFKNFLEYSDGHRATSIIEIYEV